MAGESEWLGGDPGSLLFLLCQRSINRFSRRLNHVKVFFFEYGLFILARMLWSALQPCEGTEKVVCVMCMFVRACLYVFIYVSLRVRTWLRVRMCVCVCKRPRTCMFVWDCVFVYLWMKYFSFATYQRWFFSKVKVAFSPTLEICCFRFETRTRWLKFLNTASH